MVLLRCSPASSAGLGPVISPSPSAPAILCGGRIRKASRHRGCVTAAAGTSAAHNPRSRTRTGGATARSASATVSCGRETVECGPFERLRYPILPRVRNGLALLSSTGLSSTARAPILGPLIHAQKRAHLVGGRLNPATQFAYSASSGMKTYQPLHSPVGCCCVRHDRSGTFPVQVVAGQGYC